MNLHLNFLTRGKFLIPFLSLVLSLATLEATPEPFASEGIETYSEATRWVKKNYKGETVKPWFSDIHKMTYFKEGRFMMIYFTSKKSKGYLYHRVSPSLWADFRKAKSKDDFYKTRIKGDKTIYLKLKKSSL